jgi:hypothetical protein
MTPTGTATPTIAPTSTSTPTAGPVAVLGDTNVESSIASTAGGVAEAFQFTASSTTSVTTMSIYLDSTNAARNVTLGIYTNSASNDPSGLIARGYIKTAVAGTWNTAVIPTSTLMAGRSYWIAVLAAPDGKPVVFRDVPAGGRAELNSQTGLTTLPLTWSPGTVTTGSPLSAYASP